MAGGKKIIENILNGLFEKNIIESVNIIRQHNDDPKIFQYAIAVKQPKHNRNKANQERTISASGVSFTSRQEALFKCVGEAMERYSLYSFRYRDLKRRPYSEENCVDISSIVSADDLYGKNLWWKEGRRLGTERKVLIPAEIIYISFPRKKDEVLLKFPCISTGAAGGFDKTAALINGIYEAVERDAFMNSYLGKIPVQKIKLSALRDKIIENVLEQVQKYNLELYVFDITNDLAVPTFLSILVDRTGVGPAVTIGSKSNLDSTKALIGSVAESIMLRPWARSLIGKTRKEIEELEKKDPIIERTFHWLSPQMLKNLDFLLLSEENVYKSHIFKGDSRKELAVLNKKIKNAGYRVYYTNITDPILKDLNYYVYKVFIPGLQPLYLREEEKVFVNLKRLEKSALFYGVDKPKLNNVPHPFL